jgi:hypothetical protein
MTASGASTLTGALIEEAWPGRTLAGRPPTGIALGIALLAVGLPLWAFHWRMATRKVREAPDEAGRWLRQGYFAVFSGIALGFTAASAGGVVREVTGGRASGLDGGLIARLAFWGAAWAFHYWQARQTWRPGGMDISWHRVYLYAASAVLIAVAVTGLARLLGGLLSVAFDSALGQDVLHSGALWTRSLQSGIATALAGSAFWVFHWRRGARGDHPSALRDTVVTAASAGSAALAMAAMGVILQTLFRIPLGLPEGAASARLANLASWCALVLALAPVWAYYAPVLLWPGRGMERAPASLTAEWAYRYLALAVGIASISAAAVVGIATLIGLAIPQDAVLLDQPGARREALAAVLATAVLGAAVWGPMRLRLLRSAVTPERTAVERLYLFGTTGVGLLAAAGAAAALLYILLDDAITGDLSSGTFDRARWAAAIMVTAAALAAVHLRAIRDVRGALSDIVPARRKIITLIAPAGSAPLKALIEAKLGRGIDFRADLTPGRDTQAAITEAALADLATALESAPGRHVILTLISGRIEVVSFD